ncbi:MAG: hypothetical protein HYX41_01205 [Bdellovibrio sp.]|nr:hypothetical protein [Bdellovibrio sp.]
MTQTKPLKYRDIVTSYLREDTRIHASVLAQRRVFKNELYEVFLCIYSGLMENPRLHSDLVTALIVYHAEALRVMVKLWNDEIGGDREAYIHDAVSRLEADGKTPAHLIHDAKVWCHLPFSEKDRQFLGANGIVPPKDSSPS